MVKHICEYFYGLEELEILKQQVFAMHPLPDDAWHALSSGWEAIVFKRKQYITRSGETEKYLYLVTEGVQRAFYRHGDKEATLVFSYAPSFSGIIDSLLTQRPSKYELETITASKFLRIHINELDSLMKRHRPIETWVRIALGFVLSGTLQRQVELMSFSAEEKFIALLKRSPHVLNLIPHKYLASYIGVDPATFSKMLGSVRI